MHRLLLALALAAIPTLPAIARPITVGDIAIEVPDGWTIEQKASSVMLQRQYPETADTTKMGALIQIVAADNATPASFDANFAQIVATIPDLAEKDPTIENRGDTVNAHPIRVEVRCCGYVNDVPMAQTVAGIAADKQQVVAALVVINSRSDHEQAAEADFQALIRSIRFPGDTADALLPKPGDGGLNGVYTHLATNLLPNAFGGIDFNAESEISMFDPAGLVSTAIPNGTTTLAEHCTANPLDCGTYRLIGGWLNQNEIEFRRLDDLYGTVKTEKLGFRRDGDTLVIDDGDYFKLPPFSAGTTFDGSWTYSWASSGMTATGSGGVASQHTLVLKPDGSFTRAGWSGGMNSSDAGGVTVSSRRPAKSGTYAVDGYTLTLTGADGKTEALSIFAPDRGSDELLVIGGNNFLKDD